MHNQIALEQTRILFSGWTAEGWQLIYDISYLHPEWDQLIQTYRVDTQNDKGQLIYTSEFRLYRQGQVGASDFSAYSKLEKAKLWQVIFAVKRLFFEEEQPDIVEHFIKQEYSVEQRCALYTKYLSLPNYRVVLSKFDFIYLRLPAADGVNESSPLA
jgi:hypothetical protein